MTINNYGYSHEEIHIPFATLIDNEGFTESNLKIHEAIFEVLKATHQEVYGDKNGKGLRGGLQYIGKRIIPVEQIDSDYVHGKQTIRQEINPEGDNISNDMDKNGFDLSQIPPAVQQKADGTYKILEGRTRFTIFISKKFKYILVDVYVHVDKSENPQDFSYFMNTYGAKKGFALKEDLVLFLTTEIKSKKEPVKGMNRHQIIDWIEDREKTLGTNLTNSEKDNLCHVAIEHLTGAKPILTFPNAEFVKQWLVDNGHVNTDKIMYVPITSDVHNGRKSLMRKTKKIRESGFKGEIRGIIWSGTLDGKNPVGDWKYRNLNIFDRYKESLLEEGQNYFEEAKFKDDIESLFYGCVPQCEALNKDYPTDKIVKYGDLK